jgi:large subunit ribosomal protein L4
MAEICMYDSSGEKLEPLFVELNLSEKKQSSKTFSLAVRSLLQNWRQGTIGCKDRGEVSFSTKKPWKQKGTGRARAGSLRSPLWRKGGVIFGPQLRVKELSINKKQRKLVLNNIFFDVLKKKSVCCLDDAFDIKVPNTKKAFSLLKKIGLEHEKILMFLPFSDDVVCSSFRNIPNVNIISFDVPNVFDLKNGSCWLFLKRDSGLFKEMVQKWN